MPHIELPDGEWTVLDDLTDPSSFTQAWATHERALGEGGVWRYEEPGASVTFADDALQVEVASFEKWHDAIQGFDNAKHVYFRRDSVSVPASGRMALSVDMSATKLGGGAADPRDGVISLNVADYETGLVFDLLTTGERAYALYERIPYDRPDAHAYVIDAPFHSPPISPRSWHSYSLVIDTRARVVTYGVDGTLIYAAPLELPLPTTVRIGIGMLTMQPLAPTGSCSLRGQGLVGRWRRLALCVVDSPSPGEGASGR